MRKIALLLGLAASPVARAQSHRVNVSGDVTTYTASDTAAKVGAKRTTVYPSQTFGYTGEGLSFWGMHGMTLGTSLRLSQPDYRDRLIEDETKTTRRLYDLRGQKKTNETAYDLQAGYNRSNRKLLVNIGATLGEGPYAQRYVKLDLGDAAFAATTRYGAAFTWLTQEQPLQFTDTLAVGGRITAKPRKINGNEQSVWIEQVASAHMKLLAEASTAQRLEERPRNFGLALGGVYGFGSLSALGDTFLLTRASYRTEDSEMVQNQNLPKSKIDKLKDERGYYDTTLGEMILSSEPILDLLVSVSYGYTLERESSTPDRVGPNAIVSHQVGMGAAWIDGNAEWSLKVYQSRASDMTAQTYVGGGIAWQL